MSNRRTSDNKQSAKTQPAAKSATAAVPVSENSLALTGSAIDAALTDPGSAPPSSIIALQRLGGNRAVGRLLATHSVQAKLTVGPAHDQYEDEADRTAAQVMRMAEPLVQRQTPEEEEEIRAKPLAASLSPVAQRQTLNGRLQTIGAERRDPESGFEAGAKVEERVAANKAGGSPLPGETKSFMESRFGADFSGVRVHTGAESAQLNRDLSAQAFTHGGDIFFGEGKYVPGTSAGKHLLAHELTHVVQQGGAQVRRHPSHAEEEELQRKPVRVARGQSIQLHPSHAEEEELQRKLAIEQPRTGGERIQRGLGAWIKEKWQGSWLEKRWKGAAAREREMSAKYGIQIGPGDAGGTHFSHAVLDKLEKVLDRIPLEHIRGTYMTGIGRGGGIGAASAYTQDTDTTGHIGIVQPPLGPFSEMPGWLYTMLSKGVGWQRQMMDEGAIASLAPDVTPERDQELGLDNDQREVFAGVSDVLSRGNLVEWTVRHEMGHAVDHRIQWTARRARLPQFGGWKQYDPENPAQMNELGALLLAKAGIGYPNQAVRLNRVQDVTVTPLQAFVSILQKDGNVNLGAYSKQQLAQHDAEFPRKWDEAVRTAQIAKSQPWMFPDGGAQYLRHQGRIHHLDHYGTWVSYLEAARANHGLSNYQFSSPGEWFAETYAAYYDPDPNSAARNRLNDATRNWFRKNLGEAPQPGQPAPPPPGLAGQITGELLPLAELGPELLAELEGGEQAEIGDMPRDLKQDEESRLGGF